MTLQTTNYDMFKKMECNRPLHEGNIHKLMDSVKFKNLLPLRPILVDKDYYIIDGQHRLEVAKRLGLPIYYQVQEDARIEDIYLLNDNSRCWKFEDYLNFYVANGNESYIKLNDFMKRHNLSLRASITALGYSKTSCAYVFKGGGFKYPSPLEVSEAEYILRKSLQVISYLETRTTGITKYLNGPRFQRALFIFFSCKSVDFNKFMNKLSYKLELIRPAARLTDMLQILEQIYNYMNRSPISLDDVK